jgi:RNA-directed DNA polymerase
MQYCDSRQEVTGLVVNKKVNVKERYYKDARAMTRHLVTGKKPFLMVKGERIEVSRDQLRGMLNFIYFIKSSENKRLGITLDKTKDRSPTFRTLYTHFLDYVWFYGIDEPTIICEGKTDIVYLKAAIQARAAYFPDLVEGKGTAKRIRLRFFKYSATAATLQGLSGGTGEFNNLLTDYRNRTKTFKGDATQPVIIIVDNDSGATKLFSHIHNLTKATEKVDGSKQFYYIYENLYVVPVPKVGSGDTPIEMLFEKELLNTVWNNKQIDLTGKKDQTKFYFKNDFAIHVVKAGGPSVKFDGFDPLLKALVSVKADYAKRLQALASLRPAAAVPRSPARASKP